ncbi:hypothetical protein [Spongiactinospora rosea]|nr:hypothetical protein [Spongiactinospora rosea]
MCGDVRLGGVLRGTDALVIAGRDAGMVRSLERRLGGLHAVVLLIGDFLAERAGDEAGDGRVLRYVWRVEVAARRLGVLAVRAACAPSAGGGEPVVRRRLAARVPILGEGLASRPVERAGGDGPAMGAGCAGRVAGLPGRDR